MKRIGIIGVGLLGSAVASRLLTAKFEVKGYDARPEQLKALQPQGLIAAGSVADTAAEADAVFTILPSLESVETAILGPGGLLETAPRSTTLIQMSTISPELTRRLAKAALAKGLGFLDTPMSGTSAMVERGDCAIFVGGDQAQADAAIGRLPGGAFHAFDVNGRASGVGGREPRCACRPAPSPARSVRLRAP